MGAKRVTVILERLRSICLALPEAREVETWGDPTWRVSDKIFAMFKPARGLPDLWCKAPVGVQEDLARADPTRFFVPPYVGRHGWVGARLDADPDWEFISELVRDSYRMTAPKRLLGRLQ